MRIFKTSLTTMLDSRMGKVMKILGNLVIGVGLIGGTAGALVSSAA